MEDEAKETIRGNPASPDTEAHELVKRIMEREQDLTEEEAMKLALEAQQAARSSD